jgi:L-gulono-1,4-lactone dehydrogenase
MVKTAPARWSNWGGTASSNPESIIAPTREEDISSIVKEATASGHRVKAVGAGHSFTDIAATDGVILDLSRYNRILDVDNQRRKVRVQAGITLEKLNAELAYHGLALPNLGDIAYQSVAGAISTATHGTGRKLGNLATQVSGMSFVLADGSILHCSPNRDLQTFKAAQVSLGALGVISTVTVDCVPAFNLKALDEPRKLDACLEELDSLVDRNDHFEFFWFPHTQVCLTKTNNRTQEPVRPRSRTKAYVDDIVLENTVFGLVCRIGKLREQWVPALSRTIVKTFAKSVRVDRSDRIFASPRLVRFAEMEYGIPRANAADAIRELRDFIESSDLKISFPVEVRFVAPDDIFLSPSYGRETCYIAVHMFRGVEYEPYFREVESIMNGFAGRPHWGKIHFQTDQTLAPRYPQWSEFKDVRDRLDPTGTFRNAYTDRVLVRN